MSIRVMTMVWDSNIPAPERFTLLALADWGYENGNNIYPSIKTLAKKCALSERAVQGHIQKLEKMGVLVVSRFKEGEARRTNKYHIQVDVLRRMVDPEETPEETLEPSDGCNTCTHAGSAPVQHPTAMGATSDSDGCRSCTPSVREPLVDPEKNVAQALPSAPPAADPPREDVEALCQRMLDRLVALDFRPRPRITTEWRRQARLLLDVDGRELVKALRLIDWATADSFWSQNIHSIPTFRKQYEKLRMAALKEHAERTGRPLRVVPTPPASFEALVEAADVDTARRLIKRNYLMPDHLRDNPMTFQEWRRHCAREWITRHEAEIRAALEERKAHA